MKNKNMKSTKPYFKNKNHIIYCGDCREIMPLIRQQKNILTLTDPPYGINWNAEKANRPNCTKFDNIINDDKPMNFEFLFKRKNPLIIFGAINFLNQLPFKGRWICWDKRCSEKGDKMFGSPFELAWWNSRTGYDKMYRIIHGGMVNSDEPNKKRHHPTQKPVKLFIKIIEDFTNIGDTVLDPFFGSGTTAVACERLGRKCIGIEIDPKYCEIAKRRLIKEIKTPKLFKPSEIYGKKKKKMKGFF